LKHLVVQWTEYDNVSFYPAPVDTILKLAEQSNMSVFLGLAHDTSFWSSTQRDPELVAVYLRRLRTRSESVAENVAPSASKYKSFAGWYISEEIEDFSWREPALTLALTEHLRQLAVRLHELSPGARVAISGFSNGQSDPKAFELFWRSLLKTSSIDMFMFQDGIGAGKLDLNTLPLYMEAARRATEAEHCELGVIVEMFQQIDAQFGPAPLERIVRQLGIASHEYPWRVFGFSVPEYMSPLGGAAAERLFAEYVAALP